MERKLRLFGKEKRKTTVFTRALIIMASFSIIANIVISVIIAVQSYKIIKGNNEERMLNIVDTAADMLNGDELASLKKEDFDTPQYQTALKTLAYFQDNTALKYIYCITAVDENTYVFSVDPADDPGEFGSPVVTTDALKSAYKGTPSVDQKPYEDSWGKFYSAYSPVYDSKGEIVAVVAVDFSAEQYERNIRYNVIAAIGIGVLSLTGGALLVFLMTNGLRKRFSSLYNHLSSLGDNIDELNAQITANKVRQRIQDEGEKAPTYDGKDEIAKLNAKIIAMQKDLSTYMDYVYELAHTDAMTGVNNKTRYLDRIRDLNSRIKAGGVNFSVAVFDINGLKKINDNFGHEYGDILIVNSAKVMTDVFGPDDLYRIGGDEFIVVRENATAGDMKKCFTAIDERLKNFNLHENNGKAPVGFAKGFATYDPIEDPEYKSVFKRADERMYADKQTYYKDKCVYGAAQ